MSARRDHESQESKANCFTSFCSVRAFFKMPLIPRLLVSVIGIRHDPHWMCLLHFLPALHFLGHKPITIQE